MDIYQHLDGQNREKSPLGMIMTLLRTQSFIQSNYVTRAIRCLHGSSGILFIFSLILLFLLLFSPPFIISLFLSLKFPFHGSKISIDIHCKWRDKHGLLLCKVTGKINPPNKCLTTSQHGIATFFFLVWTCSLLRESLQRRELQAYIKFYPIFKEGILSVKVIYHEFYFCVATDIWWHLF